MPHDDSPYWTVDSTAVHWQSTKRLPERALLGIRVSLQYKVPVQLQGCRPRKRFTLFWECWVAWPGEETNEIRKLLTIPTEWKSASITYLPIYKQGSGVDARDAMTSEELTVCWRRWVAGPRLWVALLTLLLLLQAPAGRRHPLRLVHHQLRPMSSKKFTQCM